MKLEKNRAKRDFKIARLLSSFGVIMAIFYFVMGVTFIVFPLFDSIPSINRYSISVLLILYGCFRLYRFFKQNNTTIKNDDDENDDDK